MGPPIDNAGVEAHEASEQIETLRARHKAALEQLEKARAEGDRTQVRAWEAAFKRISVLRYEAGDHLNAPIW
jgi:DNA/RNA-binding domain of Phe-tRNA-synthetase-like protein